MQLRIESPFLAQKRVPQCQRERKSARDYDAEDKAGRPGPPIRA